MLLPLLIVLIIIFLEQDRAYDFFALRSLNLSEKQILPSHEVIIWPGHLIGLWDELMVS